MSKEYVTENTFKKVNWSEISLCLTGNKLNIRFNSERRMIPRKLWKKIDDIFYRELPTFWYEYKMSERAELRKKSDANRRRKGMKYKKKQDALQKKLEIEIEKTLGGQKKLEIETIISGVDRTKLNNGHTPSKKKSNNLINGTHPLEKKI